MSHLDVFQDGWAIHERDEVPLRVAACRAALERSAEAIETHGTHDWSFEGHGHRVAG